MVAELAFVAAAANRVSQAADWAYALLPSRLTVEPEGTSGTSDVINDEAYSNYHFPADSVGAYAAHNAIALFDPSHAERGILQTLTGHTDRVNALRFIKRGRGQLQRYMALISASADKTVRVWKRVRLATDRQEINWVCSAVLTGHLSAVTAVGVAGGRDIPGDSDLFASSSSDGTVRVWQRRTGAGKEDAVTCTQIIDVGTKYVMSIALAFLPDSKIPVLISGATDHKVSVYIQDDRMHFRRSVQLIGHTDWVRSMDVVTYTATSQNQLLLAGSFNDGDLIVATGSQDRYIRLWKISGVEITNPQTLDGFDPPESGFDSALEMLKALVGEDGGEDGRQLSTKAHLVEARNRKKYMIMFDALLIGHDDWVHSVAWEPARMNLEGAYHQPLSLVSASADKSVIIWRPDRRNSVWVTDVRLGEVGGTSFGYYGARFSPDGTCLLAHGYHGAVQLWSSESAGSLLWKPTVGLGGHFKSVEGLSWSPSGNFVVSTSLDQTSRVWACWNRTEDGKEVSTWHEIARPQIHGYDLHCLAFFNDYGFVSGADEKVLRAFEAPKLFLENMEGISKVVANRETLEARPISASIPALGLSNKALLDAFAVDNVEIPPAVPLQSPPLEQYLTQHTLWPELNKLYGHGFELIAVASSHNGKLIASASKALAAKSEHASIRLWSTETWKEVQSPLVSHTQTVTCLQFSPKDDWLLSGGRDRVWSLFRKTANGLFSLAVNNSKSHSRIIWDCSWAPDSNLFATGSRDRMVKLWSLALALKGEEPSATLKFDVGVMSLAFSPNTSDGRYLLAIGMENGQIHIYKGASVSSGFDFTVLVSLDSSVCPVAAVNDLKWKPRTEEGREFLACGSEDTSFRLFKVIGY
ncbi:quinon protein alcohol dehydrogenase-like superfamily [Zopfochytrium polystomum]|nr:quinon protein alcohol dehydrogenase-like superfamily [Zopfochytrium polystomum]